MADEKGTDQQLDVGGGKKKKLIIIGAIVLVLALAGGGAFFFMSGGDDVNEDELTSALDSGSAPTEAASEGQKATLGSALYVPMPRPFRFNVPGAARDRFVEIRVQLLVRGGDNEEETKKHIPLIENTLLTVFSQANVENLSTMAGKASLKQQALIEVKKIMNEIAGKEMIEQVLFTGFVMQ